MGLGAKFEDVKDESGVTGKNVGLAIVFWPGIIVNEVRANKNQDSIDARISHLSAIYNANCSGSNQTQAADGSIADKLQELKDMHEKGLISDEEYEAARKRALESL